MAFVTFILALGALAGSVQSKPAPMEMAQAPAVCPVKPVALPPALIGFARPTPLAPGSTLAIGRAVTVTQVAAPAFAVPPAKTPVAGDRGAAVVFTVTTLGRYRVALGTGVWVDVVANGVALASVAHDHGPTCSPIRKMVDFDLKPGRHMLQLSGSRVPMVAVEIAKIG